MVQNINIQHWKVRRFNPNTDTLEDIYDEGKVDLALFTNGQQLTIERLNVKTTIQLKHAFAFIGGLGNDSDTYVIQNVYTPDGESLAAIWVIKGDNTNDL